MNKKIRFSLLTLLVMLCGTLFAEDAVKSIVFKEGSGTSSDSGTKVTAIADIIAEGADYVSAIPTASDIYNARVGRGIKLGTSSKVGNLVLTLKKTEKPTKITFDARQYNASETVLRI